MNLTGTLEHSAEGPNWNWHWNVIDNFEEKSTVVEKGYKLFLLIGHLFRSMEDLVMRMFY